MADRYTKCRKCGRAIPESSRSCRECGAVLRADDGTGPTLPGGALGPAILVGALLSFFVYRTCAGPPAPTVALPTPSPIATVARGAVKFGLDDAKRREIYQEILLAEDYAQSEADRRYPPLDPSASSEEWERRGQTRELFVKQATAENEKAIAKRFGLEVHQLREIAVEGLRAAWPRPPRRSLR